MIIPSAHNDMRQEFRRCIRRERLLWLSGVALPIAMLITIFML